MKVAVLKKTLMALFFLSLLPVLLFSSKGEEGSQYDYLLSILKNLENQESQYSIEGDLAIEIAYVYMKLRKIDEAEKILRKEIALHPSDYNARLFLAIARFNKGNISDALKELSNIERKLKELQVSQHRIQSNYTRTGSRPFISFNEKNLGLLYFSHGFILKSIGELVEARKKFEKAAKAGYNPAEVKWNLIQILIKQKKMDEARLELYKLKKKIGIDQNTLLLNGYFFNLNGDRKKAIHSFKEALDIDPQFIEARKNLSRTLYNQGHYKEAIELWKQVLEDNMEDVEARINIGRAFFHSGELEMARKCFQEAGITIPPEQYSPGYLPLLYGKRGDRVLDFKYRLNILSLGSILNFRAMYLLRQGNLEKAKETLKIASILDREFAPAHFNLGLFLFNSGEWKAAKKYCQLALEQNQDFLEAHNLMGRIYYMENNFSMAVNEFKRVVELDEWDATGHYNLGSAYYALNDIDSAEKEWKKAIDYERKKLGSGKEENIISENELEISVVVTRRPVSFKAHKSLGWLYLSQGNNDKALKEFIDALKIEPGDPEPYLEAGKIYSANGEKEKALFYLEKYIYLGGREQAARNLLKSLKKNPNQLS